MGRQAHLTRLALGRSAFIEPVRDSEGNFILGPHVNITSDRDYEQQFDDRGHPRNPQSKAAARRLRRAQNDVLAAVGVVVRKGEAAKSEWEKLKPSDKNKLVEVENQSGREVKAYDRIFGLVAPWFAVSLRRRLLTFYPFGRMSVTSLFWLETSIRGLRPALNSGLPVFLISCFPQMYRLYARDPDAEEIVNYCNPAGYLDTISFNRKVLMNSIHCLMFCLQMPLQAISVLQSLGIAMSTSLIELSSFIPFSRKSPMRLPALPATMVATDIFVYAATCVTSPLFISILRDYLQTQLGFRLYAMFRQLLMSAERPDVLSAIISDETDIIEDTSIPGIGYPAQHEDVARFDRRYGPKSFFGAFRQAFPSFYTIINCVTAGAVGKSRGRLDHELNNHLKSEIIRVYRNRRKMLGLSYGSLNDTELRRDVADTAFEVLNLDPEEELVDYSAWLGGLFDNIDTAGQESHQNPGQVHELHETISEMPDQIPLQITTPHEPSRMSEVPDSTTIQNTIHNDNASNVNISMDETQRFLQNHVENETPTLSTDTTLPASNSNGLDTSESISDADDPNQEPVQPDTTTPNGQVLFTNISGATNVPGTNTVPALDHMSPVPGITRAESLYYVPIHPIRRPTEIGARPTGSWADSSAVLDLDPHRDVRRKWSTRDTHRMTLLSTFAVDSFAWHASAILTNLILIPFESLYLRSIALWALNSIQGKDSQFLFYVSPALRTMERFLPDRLRILGLNEWFGGSGHTSDVFGTSKIKYASAVLLTLGLEALARGAVWYVGTRTAFKRGEVFGWGKF